ncbi:MAG TPA: hypothetical protein VFK86_09685 [Bauldia sp.]|nr:hypothetical protein [Bauldia sp.]
MTKTAVPVHRYARQSAVFGIAVGIAMLLIWLYLIATNNVPELWGSELETKLHVVGEILTALALIVSGWALWTGKSWAWRAFLLANGMLLIAVINAISWYGDRGEMGFVYFFVAVAIAAVFFVMRAEE